MTIESADECALRLTGLHYAELGDLPIYDAVPVATDNGRTLYSYRRLGINPDWIELGFLEN